MAQNDLLKRYIDAGLSFTTLTQSRAEALVRDLVKAGEVQADQARDAVAELLERSRKNSERLIETDPPRRSGAQITSLGLVSQADLDRIERRIASLLRVARPAKKAATQATADGQEGRRQEGARQEGAGEEGAGQEEGARQEGAGEEGARQEGRRAKKAPAKKAPAGRRSSPRPPRRPSTRPEPWRAAASTPSSCGGAWPRAGSRPRRTSPRGGSRSGVRRRTRRLGSSRPTSPSACSARHRASWAGAARSSTPRSTASTWPWTGRRAYDLGASTGGFTDCLLQRGAASVVAVDVGYGQLHERLRADPRVEVHERTNVRDVRPGRPRRAGRGARGRPVVHLAAHGARRRRSRWRVPAADVVLLVKPQFEAGREEAARGKGVITDPVVWRRVLEEVADALEGLGAAIMGAMASPLTGADGNVEFLLHARTRAGRSRRGGRRAARRRRSPRPGRADGRRSGSSCTTSARRRPSSPARLPRGWWRRATRCASRGPTPTSPGWASSGATKPTLAGGPRPRREPRRRRHDAAHGRPGGRRGRAHHRRERRPDGLPHRHRAGRARGPRSSGS